MSFRPQVVSAVLLTAVLGASSPLLAQDPFEQEVYSPSIAAPGEWELEAHTNYVARGSTAFDGARAPTDRQTRVTLELTHGLSGLVEVAAYGLAAARPGAGLELAGWRFRAGIRAPDQWGLPVQLAVNLEVEHTRPLFAERENAVELVPIVGWRRGPLALAMTFPLEHAIGGGAVPGWEIEPAARADVTLSPAITLTTEYFSSLGELGHLDPPAERRRMLFPGIAMHLGDDITWNAAVGFGLTDAADRLILKTAFEFPLHE